MATRMVVPRIATGTTIGTDLESGHHAPLATASTTTACAATANGATADMRSTGTSSAEATTGVAELFTQDCPQSRRRAVEVDAIEIGTVFCFE